MGQSKLWLLFGGLTRGNNGLDLIAQKNIGGKLKTLLVEVKVNSSRLSELEKLGPRGYAEDVLRRFAGAGWQTRRWSKDLFAQVKKFAGVVIRMDWRSDELIETIRRWLS